MSTPIGFSFSPDNQSIRPGANGPKPNGPQSAVQIKSFQIPNRAVPGQIAPQALLQSPGGGGSPEMQVLRQLMAAFAPRGIQSGVPQLSQPVAQPGQGFAPGGQSYGNDTRTYGVPTLPSGTDTTGGWRRNEPRGGSPDVSGVPYDTGTGFNPMPSQPEVPQASSPGLSPVIRAGQLAPDAAPGAQDTYGLPWNGEQPGPSMPPLTKEPSQPSPDDQGGFDLGSLFGGGQPSSQPEPWWLQKGTDLQGLF